MSLFSTAQLADRLYGSFAAIYQQWQALGPKDSHLWELTQGKTVLQILEQDMIDIGHYFSAADAIGERAEMFLIATFINALRTHDSTQKPARKAEQEIQKIGEWLIAHPECATAQREEIYAPLCYRISQFAVAQHIASADTLGVLRETLYNIAYHFLLRDGNITPQEDARLKEFHDSLN
jgi:hypothetical protein